MLIYVNVQFFLVLLLYWTSLGVSFKWPEQIWYLNMESIEEKTLPVNYYHLSSGHIDQYTNCGIWNTARVVPKCQHISFSWYFHCINLWCFLYGLSFIIKLKLNS